MRFGSNMQILVQVKQLATRLAVFLCDALFPVECVTCGARDWWLCEACRLKIVWQTEQVCPICRVASPSGATCEACPSELDGVLVLAHYDGVLKKAIRAYKYNFARELGEELAEMLAVFFLEQSHFAAELLIVPVPLAARRLHWRGFNQAEILGAAIARLNSSELNSVDLIKHKETLAQAKLSLDERLESLDDCFVWQGPDLRARTVMVVDDVMTTGRTLEAVASVLRAAGAREVWGVVLARG